MKSNMPLSTKAARMRLSRLLDKKSYVLVTTRADTPARLQHGKYTIIDETHRVIQSANTITPWLKENNLIKEWEYVVGEEEGE